MEDKGFMEIPQRTFFITVWAKSIHNLGLGSYLTDDNKPVDGTGKELLDILCKVFTDSGKDRCCSGAACLSAADGFHFHLGAYCPSKVKPRIVSKMFGNAHIEPQRGKKEELLDYILKRGEKWADKEEKILAQTEDMSGIVGMQGKRNDHAQIEDLLDKGFTPSEIFAEKFAFRKYEKMVRDAFFDKRFQDTPFIRNVYVEWHFGESGSGKTFFAQDLITAYGSDELYFVSDYENGGLDRYNGQHILFLDEFRGQIRFSTLLSMLDVYKTQIHCRYTNIYSLWTKVYITSPFPPEQVYKKMVDSDDRETDSIKQLLRRLDKVVYHWKENGTYKLISVDAANYKNVEQLKGLIKKDEFVSLSPADLDRVNSIFA